MDDLELLPCPFCGGAANIFDCQETDNVSGKAIACEDCEASTRVMFPLMDSVDDELAELWNARSSPEQRTAQALTKAALGEGK